MLQQGLHTDDGRILFFLLCRIENNIVPATAFKKIAAPRKKGEREENETERRLHVADKGFLGLSHLKLLILIEAGSTSFLFVV